jgi:hypothetical protein
MVPNAEGRLSDESIALAIALNAGHEPTPDVAVRGKASGTRAIPQTNEEMCQCQGRLSILSSASKKHVAPSDPKMWR